jgi:dual specificity MAP kinase phosphatase
MPWVTDHIFVAGGDYVSESWPEFQSQTGVSAVITVAPEKPGEFNIPRPWAWLWLPVENENQYTLDQLKLGAYFINAALAAGQTVLLHGANGAHRTRPLVAAHLITQGKSVARVIKEMEAKPWLPPYQGDVTLLERLVEQGG